MTEIWHAERVVLLTGLQLMLFDISCACLAEAPAALLIALAYWYHLKGSHGWSDRLLGTRGEYIPGVSVTYYAEILHTIFGFAQAVLFVVGVILIARAKKSADFGILFCMIAFNIIINTPAAAEVFHWTCPPPEEFILRDWIRPRSRSVRNATFCGISSRRIPGSTRPN